MIAATEMELSYAVYQARQQHEISLAGLQSRAARVSPGGRARLTSARWEPQPYPGHAVVSMASDLPANAALTAAVERIQRELVGDFGEPTALYSLPAPSFHQTIANTLSEDRHRQLVVERGLAANYPSLVTSAFSEFPASDMPEPIPMRMIGLGIFSTAIGLLGVFDTSEHFERILHFRSHFYGHARIQELGIRRTRPFIGHLTVAYVERLLENDERTRLVRAIARINDTVAAGADLIFHLRQAELRAYDHLAEFRPLPGLPAFRL